MVNNYKDVPDKIRHHLKSVTETSGLPETDESLEMITKNWFDKKEMFEEQTNLLDMVEVDQFKKDDAKGALMLTYSGSLISIGTLRGDERWVEYSSIKLRSDVPDIVTLDNGKLLKDTGIDQSLEFEESPIKSTSSLLKIAVCRDDVSLDEQDMRIREANIFLTNGFMKINRTLTIQDDANIGQFTMKSMISSISKRNNITQNQTKQIIDDFILMIESGLLLGEKVPVGRLGRMQLKLRPAQKARVGRNPQTGEEITIKAKPEMPVPKMIFSKYIKERSSKARIEVDSDDDNSTDE